MHCTIRQVLRMSFRLIANILPLANNTLYEFSFSDCPIWDIIILST